MSPHEMATRFVVLKLLKERLAKAKAVADTEITDTWRTDDRNAAVLPDGTKVGSVTLVKGRNAANITNEAAFVEWAKHAHPDAIETVTVTRPNPDFTARILSFARKTGEAADPATGEVVPGVTVTEGDPYPRTVLEDNAARLVAEAWQSGALADLLEHVVLLQVEGGDAA